MLQADFPVVTLPPDPEGSPLIKRGLGSLLNMIPSKEAIPVKSDPTEVFADAVLSEVYYCVLWLCTRVDDIIILKTVRYLSIRYVFCGVFSIDVSLTHHYVKRCYKAMNALN